MFSVSDILGLNPLTRKILSNAAGAAFGMASSAYVLEPARDAEATASEVLKSNIEGMVTWSKRTAAASG